MGVVPMRLCRHVALALAISVAALLGGLPGLWTGEEAGARPTDLLALSPSICISWLMDGTIPLDCYDMYRPYSLGEIAALANPDSDSPFKPADFAAIDLDANQLHSEDGQLFILAFVSNDEPVTFDTTKGMFHRTTFLGDEGYKWVCDTEDEDCNGDGVRGDGVVVAWLWPCESGNPVAKTCPEKSKPGYGTVTVREGMREMSLDFTVVGEPHDLQLVAVENTVQTGLDADSCPQETTTKGFAEAIGLPEKTVVLARVLDSEGTAVAGAFVDWKTDDRHKGITADTLTPTLDLGGLGVGTANVLCGTDEAGTVAVTGRTVPLRARLDGSLCYEGEGVGCSFDLDPMAEPHHKSVRFTVVGPPAELEITAEPARLLCDGAAGSKVSATVTDAKGNEVANGNEVRFDVRALGAATPVVVKTTDGVATSTVVPLSEVLQGVPVMVTAGDVEKSVLIACEEVSPSVPTSPSPSPPPPATASPPAGAIVPPATGSGGQG